MTRFEWTRRETRPDTKWTRLDAETNDAAQLWMRRRVLTIAAPGLPSTLKFAEVLLHHSATGGAEEGGTIEDDDDETLLNPVEVAALKIAEVNETLAEMAALVAEGFTDTYLKNLGGHIRFIFIRLSEFFLRKIWGISTVFALTTVSYRYNCN